MYAFLKRLGDLVAVLLFAPVLGLFVALVTPLILVSLGRPLLFSQVRGGLGSRPFKLWKFRSMTDERDVLGRLKPDEARLTRFGRFLRSTSLDEIPSLFNVMKGDMSIVGPRPFLYDYVALYSVEQKRRLDVRPGITGWAQVNGRNSLSWDEKFAYDLWYVDNKSTWLDLKILWLTVAAVLTRKGVSAEGEATMGRFQGHPK